MAPLISLDFHHPFLLAADHALGTGLVIWADDRALKELIRGQGGWAFDTPGLLSYLRANDSFDPQLLDLAEATLVAKGYTGVRFDRRVWDLAASIAEQPWGLVNAIRFGGAERGDERSSYMMDQVDARVSEPEALAAFVSAFAHWLIAIAGTEEQAMTNITYLCRDLLTRSWMSSSTLPYCVAGLRTIPGDIDTATVMLRAVFDRFHWLEERSDEQIAAQYVLELVSRLDPPDAYRVRAAILSRSFD